MGLFKALIGKPVKQLAKGAKKAAHVAEKYVGRPIVKNLAPIAGTVAGTFLGGPMGGMLGGALGGASQRGKGNKLKGALRGAAGALAYNAAAPYLADKFGFNGPIMSQMTGLSHPSLLNQLGVSSAPSLGGGLGFFGNAGNAGLLNRAAIPGIGQGAQKLLGSMSEMPQVGASDYIPQMNGNLSSPEDYYVSEEIKPTRNRKDGKEEPSLINFRLDKSKRNKTPLDILMELSPNIPFAKIKTTENIPFGKQKKSKRHSKENNEEVEEHDEEFENKSRKRPIRFSHGGLAKREVTGYIREGDSGGQDDDVDMTLPHGSYVANATDLSLWGDGNTDNGRKKIEQFEKKYIDKYEKFLRSGIVRQSTNNNFHGIDAKVSNGEYAIDPRAITALGKGSNEKGAKIMDKMRHNLRKQKGVKSILPPKSKPIESYMRGGR